MWTITRLENLSGVYVECYRFSIFVVTDSVYYKYQYSKTYTPTSGFNNFSSSNYSLNRCLFKPFHLLLTNTKIINQYRLTYTLCSDLNSVLTYTCNIITIRIYLLLFFSASCIFIARTFKGSPNNVINPSAS